jgi:cell division protein FtsQ
VRHPLFAIGGITVQGDVAHNSAATLRANVAPRLRGNFFTVDLAAARGGLRGRALGAAGDRAARVPEPAARALQEHQPVALWGDEGESRW